MWLSGSQIPGIQAHGFARAIAEVVGVAPGPGVDPAGRSKNGPSDKSGDRSGSVLREGTMTAVAQRYTPGGIRPEIRSDFDNTFGEKRNF